RKIAKGACLRPLRSKTQLKARTSCSCCACNSNAKRPLCIQTVEGRVFAKRWKESRRFAFELHAQHEHDVRAFNCVFDRSGRKHAPFAILRKLIEIRRNQSSGARDAHMRAEFRKKMNIRARNSAVGYIADNGDLKPFDAAFVIAYGERVEKRLSRMFVSAVARIDDGCSANARKLMRHSRRRVSYNYRIRHHSLQIAGGIDNGLAFSHAACGYGDIDCVCGKALGCNLETGSRARGRLEEKVD